MATTTHARILDLDDLHRSLDTDPRIACFSDDGRTIVADLHDGSTLTLDYGTPGLATRIAVAARAAARTTVGVVAGILDDMGRLALRDRVSDLVVQDGRFLDAFDGTVDTLIGMRRRMGRV